jgi:hypothetical protein
MLHENLAMHENLRDYSHITKYSSNRSFGLVFTTFFLIVSLLPLWYGNSMRIWAGWIALLFFVAAIFLPSVLSPLNHLWARIGQLLHRIVSPIVLAVLFYSVVVPIGIVIRMSGKKLLQLNFDRTARSYWVARNPPGPNADSLRNQF